MVRYAVGLVLMVIMGLFCFSQEKSKKPNAGCHWETIRLNIKEKEYKDTVVLLRNYIDKSDEKRILCNNVKMDARTNQEVWNSKYLDVYLQYQNGMHHFSIIQYRIVNKRDTIACYYLCDRKTKKTIEMKRFKITHHKISGINSFPSSFKGFIPVEEYDKPDFDAID